MAFLGELFYAFQKSFASEVVARNIFGFVQNFFHFALGGDSSMIGAGEPESAVAFHAMVANQNILEREHDGMTSMECSCDIGWRENDTKSWSINAGNFFFDAGVRIEKTTLFPLCVEFLLPIGSRVGFGDFSVHDSYGITEKALFQGK